MAIVNTLWRSIYRHIVRGNANHMPDVHVRLTERDRRETVPRPATRNESRRFFHFCESIKEYVLHAQSENAQAWQDALQKERRAKRRSLCLLLKLLNGEQRREFNGSRQFHVIGGSTGVRYRIRFDPFSNIDVLYPNGTVKYQLCAHPTGDVPVYDKMAAQLLHLQDPATEIWFLRKANILPARAGHYISSGAATRH